MSVHAVMECVGLMAGVCVCAFFLLGRQRRVRGIAATTFGILVFVILANAAFDAIEQTMFSQRLDIVEDNLDLLTLLCWGMFLFSLFPGLASQKGQGATEARRAFTQQMVFVFSILLTLNLAYSLGSFIENRDTLANVRNSHGPALVSIVEMRSRSNNATQEAFAYVISGELIEKTEFEAWAKAFHEESQAFRELAKLNEDDEGTTYALFEEVHSSYEKLMSSISLMFEEYEASGKVSLETFHICEEVIDGLDASFERLEQSERASFDESQANAARMLEETSFELPILGAMSIALCAGLFGILIWSFRRYSAEQQLSQQELRAKEKQHRTFLNNLPELIWVMDGDKQCTFFNKTWLNFVGRTQDAEGHSGWKQDLYPDDFDGCMRVLETAFDAREPFTLEYRRRRHDGRYRWMLDTGMPWLDSDDQFTGFIGGCIDITERKQAGELLRQRDQAFRVSTTPIAFTDAVGRITDANQAFADLFGIESIEQAIGMKGTEFYSEPDSSEQIIASVMESGEYNGEITSRKIDGTRIELQLSASRFADKNGRIIGALGTFMDVTARREAERDLRESEQRYRTLTEVAPEAIVVLDRDLQRFSDVNQNAIEMFRLSREQLLQLGPAELSPQFQPDGRESATTAMGYVQQALEGARPIFDWVHLDADGNEILCEIRLARLPSSRRLVRASLTDIRGRVDLENALSRRAIEAELLYQAVTMADQIDSLAAALQKCVDIVCEMTGWQVGHAYVPASNGKQQLEPTSIWHVDDERKFTHLMNTSEQFSFGLGEGLPGRVWKSGEPEWIVDVSDDGNFSRNRLDQDLCVKGCFGFPVKVRGQTVAILEFFNESEVARDETLLLLVRSVGDQVGRVIERKEALEATRRQHERVEEELGKAKTELILRTRLAAVGQMSAQVAHEMRNPLGAVSNAVYYLKRHVPASEEKWSEYLNLIDDEIATCNRFIGDLLNLTRAKSPHQMTTDLVVLIDRVLARHDVPSRIQIQVDCQPSPFEIFADDEQIVQVIDNLLKNALDAIGNNFGRIDIHAHRSGESAIITVHDTGSGISNENRGAVFDVLFTTKLSGTGLGLPICKQIIEKHGGAMELMDEPSPGTTFQILLPLEA